MLQIKFTVFCSKAVMKSHYWWFFCVPLGEMDKHTTCYILSAPFQSCASNTRSLAPHVAVKCVSDCKNAVSDLQSRSVLCFCFV